MDDEDAMKCKSLAEACRDLLNLVLTEAGISTDKAATGSRCLIDVGFGCGEQTIHLMSQSPIRRADKLWWDDENHQVYFDQYVGITQDKAQCQYAQERIDELKAGTVSVFCADASKPHIWSEQLHSVIQTAQASSDETWLLALDTAYHFSPSRWELIEYAYKNLGVSFMAFDLCLSPHATNFQRLSLRVLTTVMGAPWANFSTSKDYERRLVDIGYASQNVNLVDISEHVFAPLAQYMEDQDRNLKTLGLGLGSFRAAKWLFNWWGKTGVIRGMVVVARRNDQKLL